MASKLFATICVLFVLKECWVEASRNPYESRSDSTIRTIHMRHKRSSPDIFGKIKSSITSSIGKASSSSSGAASGSSASKTFAAHEKPPPPHHEKEHFDGWELKKSILNTLFQAVKAITGGVTAIKGQLIKGSGYALSHGGKLIAASGDAVTSVGKKIALSAKLLPPEKSHIKYFGSSGHDDITSYGHDELVEFAHPHDFTGFAPEPPIPQYLPVDVGYDNHFADVHEPHAHYGPPPPLTPYSHITNYIGTERKEQEHHYEHKKDATREPGLETDHEQATIDVNKKAVEALQFLLRKLPHKDNSQLTQSIDDDNFISHTKLQITPQQITQYQIPNDPPVSIPKFKPIKSSVTSTYTFQLGPINQLTRDSYGSQSQPQAKFDDLSTKPNHIHISKTMPGHGTPQLPINFVPPSKQHIQTRIISTTFRSPHSSHSHAINAQPLDLYHSMTLKHQPNQNQANQILQYLPQSPLSPSSAQTKYQRISQPPSPSHQFEIQKSVEYQLHQ